MKNHQSRPTGSLALPEANAVNNNDNKNSGSKRRRGNPRGSGRGHYGHNHFPNRNYTYHRGGYNSRGRGRVFPELGGAKKNQEKDVIWCEPTLLYLDPRTKQYTKRVTKSHISAANAPSRVEIPNKQAGDNVAQKSQERLKRGRPIGSKDKNPRKRKGTEKNSDHDENVLNETQDIKTSPEEEMNNINKKSSDIMSGDDDPEPKSVIDCHSRPDWDKWKDAMQAELNSLKNQKVFGPIVTTPRDVKLKTTSGFVIIAVYVDDLNIIGTSKEINEVVVHLKEEFEMKDLVTFEARFSLSPTKRHWNRIKHIFRYLRGSTDLARSQTGYVFLNGGTAISWRSQKQTLVATSSNHAEVIALHEASRECVWLRSMTQLIVTSCGLNKEKSPTIIHEDNAACVAQIKEGYIKSDGTKHIPPRYFAYTQDLIKDNQIEMKYVQSSNNSADLFTKALPTSVFRKHVHAIGMRHVQKT
ncbi:hypothetical protein Tco_0825026 [Tanacetum coccineum]